MFCLGVWGSQWRPSWLWASNKLLEEMQSTSSWAALRRTLPAGQGKWYFLSSHPWCMCLGSCIQCWAAQCKKGMNMLEWLHWSATMVNEILQHLTYEERLRLLKMFSLEKKRLVGILPIHVSSWSLMGEAVLSQWHPVKAQGTMSTNKTTRNSI